MSLLRSPAQAGIPLAGLCQLPLPPTGEGDGATGTFSVPQKELLARGPSQPPLWGRVSVCSGEADAWVPLPSLWSQQRLSAPFSPAHAGRRAGRQLLLCCCSWEWRSGFLRGRVKGRKGRPGYGWKRLFLGRTGLKIPLLRGRLLRAPTAPCLPAHLVPAGHWSQCRCQWCVSLQSLGHHHPTPPACTRGVSRVSACAERPFSL